MDTNRTLSDDHKADDEYDTSCYPKQMLHTSKDRANLPNMFTVKQQIKWLKKFTHLNAQNPFILVGLMSL